MQNIDLRITPLDIPAAGIWKRDCELVDFRIQPSLHIEFIKESDQSKWRLEFSEYFAFRVTTEEFTVHLSGVGVPTDGSFYTVSRSAWISELEKVHHPAFERAIHYLFFFYDEVFEVVGKGLNWTQIITN